MQELNSPPAILCDLEGTLYDAGGTVPGAVEAIAELRELGCPLRFLSNIDSRSEDDVLGQLMARGFDIANSELFLPSTAAWEYFSRRPGAVVLTVAAEAVQRAFPPVEDAQEVTHVVVGDCRDVLSYPMLDEAFRALEAGAVLLALQKGRYFVAEDGPHLDTGAIVAALEYASGQSALVLGKPSVEFGELAVASFGTLPVERSGDAVWVVGDDATSDVALGQKMGATTVQVRTGKFSGQATERVFHPASHQIDSIADLPALVRTHRAARIATV